MVTPNMNMDLPVVLVTTDPAWATKLNAALTDQIDTHDHTDGKGVQVPTAGLNINADLSFNSNDAIDLRSILLNNNVSTLPSSDVRALYVSGGNLYYNNNSGTAIQLTTGSSLNTGALALNVWSHQVVNSNLIIPSNASYIYLSVDTSSARTITLPAANAVTAGRFFIIKDTTGNALTNNISVTPAGSDTMDTSASSYALNYTFGSVMCVSDGINNWQLFKEGSPGATATILGTVKLAGDLGGTGSTFNTPRVVDATASVQGKIQLAGDLGGDSSSSSAPKVSGVTGISGIAGGPSKYFTMGSTPATDGYGLRLATSAGSGLYTGIHVRNAANTSNIRAIGVDTNDVVNIGDNSHYNQLNGGLRIQTRSIIGDHTVDTTNTDTVLLVNTTAAAGNIEITLPSDGYAGRVIIVKDVAGTLSPTGDNIIIKTPASEKIENSTSDKTLTTTYGSWTFVSDSNSNWWMI